MTTPGSGRPPAADGARWTTDAPPTDLLGPPWGDTGRLGRPFAKDPSVVRFGGRYLLYCSLPPGPGGGGSGGGGSGGGDAAGGWDAGWDVGIAESSDLVSWSLVGVVPQLAPADARGRAAPGALVLDGRVHLFLQTYGNGAADAICHAVSDDGVSFAAAGPQPVFAPRGTWSAGRAIDADTVVLGDRVVLGYATRDPRMRVQMLGFASAPRDSALGPQDWTDLSVDGPALAPRLAWERDCVEAPALCVRDGRLVCFYAGGYNNAPQQVGVAVSDDGARSWARMSDEPFLANGSPGSWNASETGHPGLLVTDDGASHLFVQGNGDGGHTWRIASLELAWEGSTPRVVARAGR